MVIQRSWKHSNDNIHQSSDDSNGSSHTISSSNTTSSKSNATLQNTITTPQMADSFYSKLNQRYGLAMIGPRMSSESLMRSLELLRINVQTAFNKEIDTVVRSFMEVYFEPAFKNLQQNLGDSVCSEDVLRKMACALLENSKSQYNIRSRPNITALLRTPADTTSLRTQLTQQLMSAMKRPATVLTTQPTAELIIPPKKPTILQIQQRLTSSLPTIIQPAATAGVVQQLQSLSSTIGQSTATPPARRRIFWNTSNISTDTKFILDVQANQAFGLGIDGRERLASKHPELIRYLPDEQDRNWLVEEKIIPVQNKNSRFLFLVYDEVVRLSESETYRNRENMNLTILHIFKVPNFIIQKMRTFFVDLNIKSRGLITNSFTVGAGGVSQLRAALLQGSPLVSATTTAQPAATVAVCTSSSDTIENSKGLAASTSSSASTVAPVAIAMGKPKSSLSSSHATLTALLNGNNEASSSIEGAPGHLGSN